MRAKRYGYTFVMALHLAVWSQLRSARHALSWALSERLGKFRRAAPEKPAVHLALEGSAQHVRLDELCTRYKWRFETQQDATGALQSYEYLDYLDQAQSHWKLPAQAPGLVQDVGCASFTYAAALHAFFKPNELVGIELEGYRRLSGGVNRAEKATSQVSRLANTAFVIADYTLYRRSADRITAFFPFVTPQPVLGWRLPLSVLRPAALFAAIRGNLNPDGELWMVNHSETEASVAAQFAGDAGLHCAHVHVAQSVFRERTNAVVVSLWRYPSPNDATAKTPRR